MVDRHLLAAWVAGGLDAARAAEVADAVARDPLLRAEAERLGAGSNNAWPADDGWRLPAPQRGTTMAVMGAPCAGDPITIALPAGDGEVWVLHRAEGDWEQVLPGLGAASITTLSLAGREVLVVPTTPGTHDWLVIVAPTGTRDLQDAVARGAVPVVRVRVEVG